MVVSVVNPLRGRQQQQSFASEGSNARTKECAGTGERSRRVGWKIRESKKVWRVLGGKGGSLEGK